MKRITIRAISYLLIVFIFCSCNNNKLKIGFMLPHMGNKRYPIERDVFILKIKEYGGEVFFFTADNDPQKQMDQLDELINKGVDIVVLDPVNRFTAAGMVRKIHKKGIKIISYDRLIANCAPDAFVSFDGRMIGEQMASYVISKKPNGNYVIFNGDKSDANAVWINEGFYKILSPYISSGKITVTFETFIENWSEADANNAFETYLKCFTNKPDVILASSDFLSRGCINALITNNYSPSEVLITGQGAEPFSCRYMLNGQQTMSVYKSVKKLATLAANLAVKMARDENYSDILTTTANNGKYEIPANFLKPQVVDSSSIRSIVVVDGMLTENELKE
jgi:D-xylose transport system substrate-binding protein